MYIYNRAPSTSERFYRNTYICNRAPSTSERSYIIISGRAPIYLLARTSIYWRVTI